MRYYSTKNKYEFIVVKHKLKGMNNEILGIRYRGGYGVVAKDSKEYQQLKKIPMAIEEEYPITQLLRLKCVTSPKQIETIWGKPIYNYFKEVQSREEKKPVNLQNHTNPLCSYIKEDGNGCKGISLGYSKYCRFHAIYDERIKDEIENLPMMPVKDKRKRINSLVKGLKKLEGK